MKAMSEIAHFFRTLVIFISVAGGVAGTLFLGDKYFQLREQEIKYAAIDACGQLARVSFESKDANGQITRSELPATDSYKQCLKEKGIETSK